MALTTVFGELNDWPGRLFQVDDGAATILSRTPTLFQFRHTAGDFAGYTVSFRGAGFSYLNGTAVDGTIGSIEIRNGAGQVLFNLSGLSGNAFASDLAQVLSDIFGSPFEDGPGPDGKMAWNRLFSGNDTITGTSGDDRREIVGLNAGNDVFNMGAGDDAVGGSLGNDTMRGGDGFDLLSYRETAFNEGGPANRGLVLNVATGIATDPWGFRDVFSGFEEFRGSRFDDRMVQGNGDRARFEGMRGNDTLVGGSNIRDEVVYGEDYWVGGRFGIVADLQVSGSGNAIVGTIRDGFGNTDRVESIERVSGTRFADSFTGSSANNVFWGGEGRDSFNGRGGFDAVDFDRDFAGTDPAGANVDLRLATGQVRNDGFGNVETFVSIEGLRGTDRSDRFIGNAAENSFEGREGADTLTGGGGIDYFVFVAQDEMAQGDTITDFQAQDRLGFEAENWDGMTQTVRLVNGLNATTAQGTFLFNAANDTLTWDANGTSAGARTIIAVLQGVNALTVANFDIFD